MWPLNGLEIVELCDGDCALPKLAELRIAGVKADGAPPQPDDLFVALREPAYDFDGHDWVLPYLRAGAALALVAADWPLLATLPPPLRQRCIVVPEPLCALRKIAAALRRRFTFPIIAVGGSNGKTTTKDMIATLLSTN
jgi:UDP-N-acetylmuramoyl-tripeptide--D-alanyl-D-alanine ligase